MTTRIPLPLPAAPYLQDHRFEDRPVLPAVEAMALLATAVAATAPGVATDHIQRARFDKFLPLDPSAEIELWAEVTAGEGKDRAAAALKSKRRGKRGIARTLTHAEMQFGGVGEAPAGRTIERETASNGLTVPSPERIYTELVPFGPGYRNLSRITAFDAEGIQVEIAAPAVGGHSVLGSPFVLDAAFHAACVWGQRFAGIVAFPVALQSRRILHACRPGRHYRARVRVREDHAALLIFDVVIEARAEVCEVVEGVRMRDVSGGRRKPPAWILAEADSGAGA